MMVADFDLWAACQRLFNVTPVVVQDLRAPDGGGTVRFLATLHNSEGIDVADCYDNEQLVALGIEDQATDDRVMAVEETFLGEPCLIVVRSAASFLELGTQALDVTIILAVNEDTINQAMDLVRAASLPEHFHSFRGEDEPVVDTPDTPAGAHADTPPPDQLRKRSWLERLLGRMQ